MEPKDFFRVVLRRKRTLITAIIIVVATSMFGSIRKTPQYQADCRVLIQAVGPDVLTEKGAPSIEVYSSFPTIKAIIESPRMAQKVADLLKLPYDRVGGRVNATLLPTTSIFEMRTLDVDQKFVATLCNGYAAAILQDRRESAHRYIGQIKTTLISETKELYLQLRDVEKRALEAASAKKSTIEFEVERATILSQIRDYQIRLQRITTQEQLIDEGGGQVIKPAGAIGHKLGPNHKRDAVLALMVGLIFGMAIAFVREYLDDTMRDKESITSELGIPVVGTMPTEGGAGGYVDPSSKAVEAARSLRTNLGSIGFPNDIRALVVTSTLSKRRANTVANLAAAVAEAGRTVLVIGADFRNPRLHEQFGVGNAIGLSSVIRGQMSIDQAVRPVPGLDGVFLLPTGPQVSNPGELLSSDAMDELLADARHWADAVIIDAPPVLTAADASVLGTIADGVLLVMSAGRTQRDQATEAKDQLIAGGANVLGIVLAGGTDVHNNKGFSLGSFRRDDDEDEMPPLMPYGAWSGAGGNEWGAPAMYEAPLPPRSAATTRARSTKTVKRNGNGGLKRNGNGNGGTHRNGGSYGGGSSLKRNGNGNGASLKRNGNGNGGLKRNGNGASLKRNGNGNGGLKRNGNGNGGSLKRNGNGNGGLKRNGNGNGHDRLERGRNGGYAPVRNGNGKSKSKAGGTAKRTVGQATRTGNGNGGTSSRNGGGSRKVVAARRPQRRRDW